MSLLFIQSQKWALQQLSKIIVLAWGLRINLYIDLESLCNVFNSFNV